MIILGTGWGEGPLAFQRVIEAIELAALTTVALAFMVLCVVLAIVLSRRCQRKPE